jgi:hypothetical protein
MIFRNCQRFERPDLIFTPAQPIVVKFLNGSNGLVRSVAQRAGFGVEQN